MWPSTSCPLSSLTRNIVLGRASVISPSISLFSSLAIRRGAYLTLRLSAQPTCPRDRLLPLADLAGVLGCLYLGKQLAHLGARGTRQLDRELIPAHGRLGRAVAVPVERRREHLACQVEMGLDRLLGGERAATARGERSEERRVGK